MKKNLILAAFLLPAIFSSNASELLVNATDTYIKKPQETSLDLVITHYQTSFLDLPFWEKARVAGFSTLAGACVWLITRAFSNVFVTDRTDLNILDIKSWNTAQMITTPASMILVGKVLSDSEKPEGIAKNPAQNNLLRALLLCKSNAEIQKTLDQIFITEHFPRAIAFQQLSNLKASLNKICKLLVTIHTKDKKSPHIFNTLVNALSHDIHVVDNALLLIKNDPRWFEECNAHTLKQSQAVHEARLNAELAGSAVDLAHLYTRNRR